MKVNFNRILIVAYFMKYQTVEFIVDSKPVMDSKPKSTQEYNNLYSVLSYINLFWIFFYRHDIAVINKRGKMFKSEL